MGEPAACPSGGIRYQCGSFFGKGRFFAVPDFIHNIIQLKAEGMTEMKKLLKKGVALLCSIALLFTAAAAFPSIKPAAAAASESLRLTVTGTDAAIYDGSVSFTPGETAYDILISALSARHIAYDMPDGSYGRYIQSIDGQTPSATRYWSLFINDVSSPVGISALHPADGDEITVALAGTDPATWATLTDYPLVSLSDPIPRPGESVTISVTRNVIDYTTYTASNQPVAGANVVFNHTAYTTGTDGKTPAVTMPAAGTYPLAVSKSNPDATADYPLLVPRTVDVTVSAAAPAQREIGVADTVRTVDLGTSAVSRIDVRGGSASLRLASSAGSYLVPNALQTTARSADSVLYLSFAADTTVTGPSGWNGSFALPQAAGAPAVSGITVREAVTAGASVPLTLDRPAALTLPGQSGSRAGYLDESGNFHAIAPLSSNDPAGVASDGYYDDGTNLIIYTRHFSTFVTYTPAPALTDSTVSSAINGAAQYLSANDSSDWTVFALARAGKTVPAGYAQSVADQLAQNGGQFSSPTDLEKAILILRAAGSDPTRFNGVNLVDQLAAWPDLDAYGVTAYIYGLLALDSGKYAVPSGAVWTGDSLTAAILGYQKTGGGFSLGAGEAEDPDLTAMALTALAPHAGGGAVSAALTKALGYLRNVQQPDGGFVPTLDTAESAESDAQVVIALSSLGINPETDERFAKYRTAGGAVTRVTVLDNLLGFKQSDGGFAHKASGASDIFATEQSLMAFTAYRSLTVSGPALYDLSGLTVTPVDIPAAAQGSAGQSSSAADEIPNPRTGGTGIPVSVAVAAALAFESLALARSRRKE